LPLYGVQRDIIVLIPLSKFPVMAKTQEHIALRAQQALVNAQRIFIAHPRQLNTLVRLGIIVQRQAYLKLLVLLEHFVLMIKCRILPYALLDLSARPWA
jgi:hypothetical protein